jgi:uncharacterized membrane protein YsdA (DUF1294 family)
MTRSNAARGPRYRSPYRRYALIGAVAGLLIALAAVVFLDLPLYLGWIVGLSVATFALYGFDKRRAVTDGGRVPEMVLHGLALAGGFPGGWAGRTAFRHKTRHTSFLVVLICATLLHGAIAWWLYR